LWAKRRNASGLAATARKRTAPLLARHHRDIDRAQTAAGALDVEGHRLALVEAEDAGRQVGAVDEDVAAPDTTDLDWIS